jgi:hypothetical protein
LRSFVFLSLLSLDYFLFLEIMTAAIAEAVTAAATAMTAGILNDTF